MNADGSEPRQLTRVGVMGHFLRWAPEGDAIVFRCLCGGVVFSRILRFQDVLRRVGLQP